MTDLAFRAKQMATTAVRSAVQGDEEAAARHLIDLFELLETVEDSREVLGRLVALKTHDAHRSRSNAGRWTTVNVPTLLWGEVRDLVSTLTDPDAKTPGRPEVALEVLTEMGKV